MINTQLSQTVTQFEELPFAGQAAIVWQKGRPIATRYLPDFRLHLYAVDGFFVEMWVCRRRFIVTLFRTLTDTDDLVPYVKMDDLVCL